MEEFLQRMIDPSRPAKPDVKDPLPGRLGDKMGGLR